MQPLSGTTSRCLGGLLFVLVALSSGWAETPAATSCVWCLQQSFSDEDYAAYDAMSRRERAAYRKTLPKASRRAFRNGHKAWKKGQEASTKVTMHLENGIRRLDSGDYTAAIRSFEAYAKAHSRAQGLQGVGPDASDYYIAEAYLRRLYDTAARSPSPTKPFEDLGKAWIALKRALEDNPALWRDTFSRPEKGFRIAAFSWLIQTAEDAQLKLLSLHSKDTLERLQKHFADENEIDLAIRVCKKRGGGFEHIANGGGNPEAGYDHLLLIKRKAGGLPENRRAMRWIMEHSEASPDTRGRAGLMLGHVCLTIHFRTLRRPDGDLPPQRPDLLVDEAEEAFRIAMRHLAEKREAESGLAVTHLLRGGKSMLTQASKLLRKVIEADGQDLGARMTLALALADLGDEKGARGAVAAAAAATPLDLSQAWLAYSALLERHGRSQMEIAAFHMAAEASPKDADLWHTLGLRYREAGKYDKAVEALRHALEAGHADAATWVMVAETHVDLDQPEKAEECFAKALKLDPDNAATWRSLRLHLQQRKEDAGAATTSTDKLQAAISEQKTRPWIALCELGFLQGLRGNLEAAAKAYIAAYGRAPDAKAVDAHLAELVALMKDGTEDLINRILDEVPTRGELTRIRSERATEDYRQKVEETRKRMSNSAYSKRMNYGHGLNHALIAGERAAQQAMNEFRAQVAPHFAAVYGFYPDF